MYISMYIYIYIQFVLHTIDQLKSGDIFWVYTFRCFAAQNHTHMILQEMQGVPGIIPLRIFP